MPPRDRGTRGESRAANVPTVPPTAVAEATPDPVPTHSTRPVSMGAHYEDMGRIAVGGMGEVRRAWDLRLNRSVAMKILRTELCEREDLVHRFVEEAQATAQLEHPGIVPVYDYGHLPSGRPFFTMKEIRGRTLLDVIEELHAAAGPDGWGVTATGWTFQRVIQVFQQVCEAIAYAHSRGVLHRDLKPTNVMVGAFGEVVVMDWGLAKVQGVDGFGQSTGIGSGAHHVVTDRSHKPAYVTRSGSVAGTPNYMPPEQAAGEASKIGPWSDVYALGAVLYEILTDRPPYMGEDLDAVVEAVLAGPPPPVRMPWQGSADDEGTDDGLRSICRKALARDIADRYMDASTIAEAVAGWLDSLQLREQAVALVRQAGQLEPVLDRLRTEAAILRSDAASVFRALPRHAADADKRRGWALEDRALAVEEELARHESRYVHLLRAALTNAPGMEDAAHRLRAVADARAPRRRSRGGTGLVSLHTDVPCRIVLRRMVAQDRRLRAEPLDKPKTADLTSPLERMSLPAGSYRADLYAEGHVTSRVLLRVDAGNHTVADPPGPRPPVRIALARHDASPPGTVGIAPGWTWIGGDREVRDSLPRTRVWTDAYAIGVHPVTVADYVDFLDALSGNAPADVVRRMTPPAWRLSVPPNGVPHDAPVTGVPFDAAWGYANWKRDTTGWPWRLPTEREWERAARGVDERIFPWGDHFDPSWCCVAESHEGPPVIASIHAHPYDESPWGVRGMGGNARDWVTDDASARGALATATSRWVRGGHYLGIAQFARCALRYRLPTPHHPGVGFRLVCGD